MKTRAVILLEDLKFGGVQRGALLLASRLDPSRFDIEVWHMRGQGGARRELEPAFRAADIPLVFTRVQDFHDSRGVLALAERLRRERVALLNTRSIYPNLLGRLAGWIAGTPCMIAGWHSTYAHRWKRKFEAWERLLIPHTAQTYCVSAEVRDFLKNKGLLPPDGGAKLRNGIDLSASCLEESQLEARRRLDWDAAAPCIAYIGRLEASKNVDVFIRAMPAILKEDPRARFYIAGRGRARKSLESLARRLELTGVLQFLGPRDDVPRLLRALDCVVQPSAVEGLSRIILECFAAGTPVVVTPAPGVAEVVRHEENGLIVPIGDPDALARAVLRSLRNPEEAARRVRRAGEDVKAFTLESWIDGTEALFRAAAESRRAEIEASGRLEPKSSPLADRRKLRRFRSALRWRRTLGALGVPDRLSPSI